FPCEIVSITLHGFSWKGSMSLDIFYVESKHKVNSAKRAKRGRLDGSGTQDQRAPRVRHEASRICSARWCNSRPSVKIGTRRKRSGRRSPVGNQPGIWKICRLVADGKGTR